MPEAGWTATVRRWDVRIGLFEGILETAEDVTRYRFDIETGRWLGFPDDRPAEAEVGRTFEWLADEARRQGLTELRGTWGGGGPQVVP